MLLVVILEGHAGEEALLEVHVSLGAIYLIVCWPDLLGEESLHHGLVEDKFLVSAREVGLN